MNTGDMTGLDREIARLEKDLAKLYQKRMGVLEAELQSAKARAGSLLGGTVAVTSRSAASTSAPVVKKEEKALPAKGKGKGKGARKRRRMSTEEVERRLIETVRAAGSAGLSLKGISEGAGLKYQTTAKKLKDMAAQFVKKGELKEARYTLKA